MKQHPFVDAVGSLSFENCFVPRFGDHQSGDQVLNDLLLLACHRSDMNNTDDGVFVFDEHARAAIDLPQIGSPLSVYG